MHFTAVLLRIPPKIQLTAPRLQFRLRPHVTIKNQNTTGHLTNQTLALIKKLRDNEYDTDYCQNEYKALLVSLAEDKIRQRDEKAERGRKICRGGEKLNTKGLRTLLKIWTPNKK